MNREIRFKSMGADTDVDADDYGRPVLANMPGGMVTAAGYTTLVSDDSGEWQVVVTMTGRQDGRIAWTVLLVQVDDLVRIETGLSTYAATHDELNRAIARLTAMAGWIEPLNKFTTE